MTDIALALGGGGVRGIAHISGLFVASRKMVSQSKPSPEPALED
jgi:hypothetical protein